MSDTPEPPEVRPEATPEFYLDQMRTSLAERLTQRVEYRDMLISEVIRAQRVLATAEESLTQIREECEAMAEALDQLPPPTVSH